MPTPRVLLGMTLGALVATAGALFLGEYEFDELLPILSGALLGLIVAEVVVSVGRVRNVAVALSAAAWSATAVVLAGVLDANETGPIKWGAYLSAGLAALAALLRANRWRKESQPDPTSGEDDDEAVVAASTGSKPLRRAEPARRAQPARRGEPVPRAAGRNRPDPARSARPVSRGAEPPSRRDPAEPPRITVTTRRRPRTDRDR